MLIAFMCSLLTNAYKETIFFLRRRFISTKQIYKKNHTYNTKHTIYKRKEIKAKKRLEILKEGRK